MGRRKDLEKGKMASHEQQKKSRVLKVDSEESWEFFISQAKTKGCPVVVHFSASWCMPSMAMTAFFEKLASNYQDMLFLEVDVDADEVKGIASKMEIKAMPTFVLMRDGIEVDKLVGANPVEITKRTQAFYSLL